MSDVWTRPLLRRGEVHWGSRVPWLAAVLAAGWALVAGLALAALPGLALWIADGADAQEADPLRLGAAVWLAAHRVGLDVDGVPLQIAPGGLSILVVLLIYRSARWAAHVAGVETPVEAVAVIAPTTATYALGGGLVAGVSATDHVSASPLAAVAWSGALALTVTAFGVVRDAGLVRPLIRRLPVWQRVAVRGALIAVAMVLAVGAALVVTSALVNSERIAAVGDRLNADLPGAVVLAVLGASLAANATVWAAAFALGPGFAVGTGTSVAPGGVELGLVPALPALAALPAEDFGPAAWLVLAGPIAAGVLAGAAVRRHGRQLTQRNLVAAAAAAGVLAAVMMAGLAYLSGGSAGAARLAEIGPVPWQVGLATLALVGIPAVMVAAIQRPQDTEPPTQRPRAQPPRTER